MKTKNIVCCIANTSEVPEILHFIAKNEFGDFDFQSVMHWHQTLHWYSNYSESSASDLITSFNLSTLRLEI